MREWQNIRLVSSREYGKTDCGVSWNWTRLQLEDFDIWYVLSGAGEIHINGKRYEARKGTCCVLRPGDHVRAFQNPENRMTLIYFHFQPIDSDTGAIVTDDSTFPSRHNLVHDPYWLEQYLHSLLECAGEDDLYHEEMVNHLLKLIFTNLLLWQNRVDNRSRFRHRHLMWKVKEHIHAHIFRPLTREELARLVSLSPRYVSSLFKEYAGVSLKEYMKKARLEKARTLLTETDKNVTQVAEALGYKDIYLFSNQFKREYGTSPSTYQRNVRKARLVSVPIRR